MVNVAEVVHYICGACWASHDSEADAEDCCKDE